MALKHDASTALASPDPNSLDAVISNLAGARYRKPRAVYEPVLFIPVALDKLETILGDADEDTASLHVLGSTPDQIVNELMNRYPSPIEGTSRVREVRGIEMTQVPHRSEWQRKRKRKTFALAWALLSHPVLSDTGDLDVEGLIDISRRFGPVCLETEDVRRIFGGSYNSLAEMEADGFIVVHQEKLDLYRVNFNPRAFLWRKYRTDLKIYQARCAELLPKPLLYDLYRHLSPHNSSHPCCDVIDGKALSYHRGWGHWHQNAFSTDQIADLVAMNRKLGGTWWRSAKFADTLRKAVAHLHGMSQHIAEQQRQAEDYRKENYQRYCEVYRQYRETLSGTRESRAGEVLFDRPAVASYSDYSVHHPLVPSAGLTALTSVYKFIRREARALHIRVPARPVPPVKPGRTLKRKEKHARKKALQDARRLPGTAQPA